MYVPQTYFVEVVFEAGAREAAFAIVGGFIWNIGNILLLSAIVIAGLAVVFPWASRRWPSHTRSK